MNELSKTKMQRMIFMVITFITLADCGFSQCSTATAIWDSILNLENSTASNDIKLEQASRLLHRYEDGALCKDSVYARLLHRIATLQYLVNGEVATPQAIEYMLSAIAINTSGQLGAAPDYAVNSYFNLGAFYQSLGVNSKALRYYDSVISINKARQNQTVPTAACRVLKADILFRNGDYQQCVDECIAGLAEPLSANDDYVTAQLFNRRAQSYFYLEQYLQAGTDSDSAQHRAGIVNNDFEQATAIIIKAQISAELNRTGEAMHLFGQAVTIRLRTKEYQQIADDYTDWGNFLLKKLNNYQQAQQCYLNTIQYAQKAGDAERLCKGYINLGEVASRLYPKNEYKVTRDYYRKALQTYGLTLDAITDVPQLREVSTINNADMLLVLLGNRTELLLQLFRISDRKEYLNSCLASAMLTDSVLTQIRQEQLGELSKLYWRNQMRSFFARALEACYLADDMAKAFYFMEKSRAVLLAEKLNELGASAHLPAAESRLEQHYKAAIVYARQKLLQTHPQSPAFQQWQLKLVQAKEKLGAFLKKLEQNYPVYYQYRYADAVPGLQELQQELGNNQQNFVYYFLQDTTGFILLVQPDTSKMFAIPNGKELTKDMATFLQWCSDKQQLNNHFRAFTVLANQLYQKLIEPLQLNNGRVVVCQDNMLLPFEALCKDADGEQFLLYDYSFSYVYSAGYLMQKMATRKPISDFIGFAPVLFQDHLQVPDLKYSAIALDRAATFYSRKQLLTGTGATRRQFLQHSPDYSVVNVYSHAVADADDREPVLYMQDSVIHLSELQLLYQPCTQLMVLSACQTNVGRYATGEGIYSLARGFSAAGIPAVAATLWKADEEAIYAVTEKMHGYLASGMPKDEALQKAKLYFIAGGDKEKLLPYYWANLVLVGNAGPIPVQKSLGINLWPWAIVLVAASVVISTFVVVRRKLPKRQ